jgi:hypothetical protein
VRPSSILSTLLLSSLGAFAQTDHSSTRTVLVSPPASESCPVNFSAERKPFGGVVQVDKGATIHFQALQLNFASSSSPAILKVNGTLHGMTPGLHVSPISFRDRSATRATETFQLTADERSPLHQPSISIRKLGTVDWLELTRIEFADGTTWHASSESRCVVAPSGLVLVDSKAEPEIK